MPPRLSSASNPNTFSSNDAANEVVCPLVCPDGSQCRKRCSGDKRFRSMQEHIRRAHPAYYIPKLPASGDSIRQMVERAPDESILAQQATPQHPPSGLHYPHTIYQHIAQAADHGPGHRRNQSSYNTNNDSSIFVPGHLRRGSLLQSTNAAVALAQLSGSRPGMDWQGHSVGMHDAGNTAASFLTGEQYEPEADSDYTMNHFFANSVNPDMFGVDSHVNDLDHQGLQASSFERSFFPRAGSSSLPQFARKPTGNRPRKSSVNENARKGKHERDKSKDLNKRLSHDRKGISLEPSNKRWESLIDAAQSATEEEGRDLTPIPQSPRSSMPPFNSSGMGANHFQSYTASPLQNTLLPQDTNEDENASFNPPGLEPFPSVESSYDPTGAAMGYQSHQHQASGDSAHSNIFSSYAAPRHHASSTGSNFHMPPEGLSSSSPGNTPQLNNFARPNSGNGNGSHYPHPLQTALAQAASQHQQQHPYSAHHASFSATSAGGAGAQRAHLSEASRAQVEHYCAACKLGTPLVQSYGCTECMCGICRACFEVLTTMDPDRSDGCPHCHVRSGKYKPFMLDLR